MLPRHASVQISAMLKTTLRRPYLCAGAGTLVFPALADNFPAAMPAKQRKLPARATASSGHLIHDKSAAFGRL
jgi:hypothetical protein